MRFICNDFTDNTNDLYYKSNISQNVIQQGGYLYYKSNQLTDKDSGLTYSYLNDTVREILLSTLNYDGTARTPSAWLTYSGLTGTDHTAFTNTMDFNVKSAMQVKSGYFYSIVSEDGIVFAKPKRISTSKQLATYTVISEFKSNETDFNFEGESTGAYKISDDKQTVTPVLIDDAMKTARMNKYKSLQNVITIQSGFDANPLDYVFRNGSYYILMSRANIKNDLFLYTCVLESDEAYTFAGDDITPFIPVGSSAPTVRAFVTFDGTTSTPCTIIGSYNVSSVTKEASGVYTINFTNALSDALFCIQGIASGVYNGSTVVVTDVTGGDSSNNNSINGCTVSVYGLNQTRADSPFVSVQIIK